jgi:hypothetical protein
MKYFGVFAMLVLAISHHQKVWRLPVEMGRFQ